MGSRIVVLFVWLGLSAYPAAFAQDRVYRYTDRDGRTVFTNAGNVGVAGKALEPLELPPLAAVDFASATPGELRALDARVVTAHRALQSGPTCQAVRAASERPWTSRLWDEQRRDLSYAAGLLVLAILTFWLLRGHRLLRFPFAALPLSLSVYLLVDLLSEARAAAAQLDAELEACGAKLPEGNEQHASDVRSRLASVLDLRATIAQAQERRDRQVEKMLSEARR